MIGAQGGAQRAAGIAGRGLHPDALEDVRSQQLAVGDAIQRHAAGQAEVFLAGVASDASRQLNHNLFGDGLDRGR